MICNHRIEGSLEVKLPTIWTDEKQSREEAERRERLEERRSEQRKWEERRCTGARKGSKVAQHCVFPMFCGSRGSKSRLAKAAGAEPCGQKRDEKLHAVVGWSTFGSQIVQNTPCSDHFWKLRCRKFMKIHAVVARSTFPSQNVKSPTCSDHFWTFRCRAAWPAQGVVHLVKSEQNVKAFSSISKKDGRSGAFEEDLERCIFRGRRGTRDMFIRDVRRSGGWFPERGCISEHQIFSILCHRCSTSYDQASLFSLQAQCFRDMDWKNRQTHWYEAFSSALNIPLSKEVSQNCFVFNVANFKIEEAGSLAEWLPFWRYQVQKLRKSCRIASFSSLQIADRQIDG